MCPGKHSFEVFAVAPIDRYALPHHVQKAYRQTIRIWKSKRHGTRCPEGIYAGTCRPKCTFHGVCHLEEIHLDSCLLDGKCPGTRCLQGICPGTSNPNSTCCGMRHLEEIHSATHRLEEICFVTSHLEEL